MVRRHLPVRRVAQQTAPGDGETPAAREKHMGNGWTQKTFLLTAVMKKYSDPDTSHLYLETCQKRRLGVTTSGPKTWAAQPEQ